MNLGSIKSIPTDVLLLKITCAVWIVAKIYSYKLWITNRIFPVIPTFDFIEFPNQVHLLLFIFSLIGMVGLLLFSQKSVLIIPLIVVEIASCLLDQMRWQPWEFQYLITLILFVLSKKNKNFFRQQIVFLIAFTYIFSGLHKISGGFLYHLWDKMVLQRFLSLSIDLIKNPWMHYSGLVLAFVEIFIGVGLLFFSSKKSSYFFAIAMHVLIILIFGPWGISHNLIIIPWNLGMICMLIALLQKRKQLVFTKTIFSDKPSLVFLFLVGVMPIFSFVEKWDHYFSFNLYSGTTKTLVICVDSTQKFSELEPYIWKKKHNKYCLGSSSINTMKWALSELKVPIPPEERIFIKFKRNFIQKFPNVENRTVYYWYPYKKNNIVEIQ